MMIAASGIAPSAAVGSLGAGVGLWESAEVRVKAVGTVERKITTDTEAGGRKVKASEDEPQYLVRSEKSGGTAVHKPSALRRA